jgi:hypothetical protein
MASGGFKVLLVAFVAATGLSAAAAQTVPPPNQTDPTSTAQTPPGHERAEVRGGRRSATRDCLGASYDQLSRRASAVMHRSLLSTTQIIGAGSQSQIVLTGPLDAGVDLSQAHLRTFFVDTLRKDDTYSPPVTEARLVADSLSAPEQKPIAAKLQINEASNALLQVDVPDDATDMFYQTRQLVVFACKPGGFAPLLMADAQVRVSPQILPVAAGITIDLLLYLFCAVVIYYARLQLVKQRMDKQKEVDERLAKDKATNPQALPILRVVDVTAWKFRRCLNPVALTSDIFDKGNLSNLQILFFSLLVSYGLIYIVLRTGELSSISTTVVGLLGISAIGSLGAKLVGNARDRLSTENWAFLVDRKVLPINDPGRGDPRWSDLIMSDSELDLYKLQALVFSLIVGLGMIVGGFSLATFSVPQELLEVLGLSQLVFVGGRAAKPATMGDLDDLLDELRTREAALRRAAVSGYDVDNTGKPVDKKSDNTAPYKTIAEAKANGAVPNAAQRYLETEAQVKMMLEAWSHREVDTTCLEGPRLA